MHWLGLLIQLLHRRLPRGRRQLRSGLVLALLPAAVAWAATALLIRMAARGPAIVAIAAEAFLLKQTFAARALFDHAIRVQHDLEADALPAARESAARMVSRPTAELSAELLASAVIESVAENFPDSVLAPWLAFALGGTPAAAAYRAINTADAIVGYPDQGSLGAPTARLDDCLNLAPARLSAALLAQASDRPSAAWAGARRDARRSSSPNSGWPMAAMACALQRRLEKLDHYTLNPAQPLPDSSDVGRAIAITIRATWLAAALTVGLCAWRGMRATR